VIQGQDVKAKGVWVVAEQTDGELHQVTLEMLGEGRRLAKKLSEELCAVLIGYNVATIVDTLARYGAERVYLVEHQLLSQYTTDAYTAILVGLIRMYMPSIVMLGATPNGQDLAPRVATRLKVGLMTDCTQAKINDRDLVEATKPVYDGKFYATVVCPLSTPQMMTISPGSIGFGKSDTSRQAHVIVVKPEIAPSIVRTKVVSIIEADPKTLDITEADIVVSGGRGVGGVDKWQIVEEFANALGASIGGTRVAMDMGCIPRSRLVGQTGKAIAPRLYFAVGISGASQHLTGIEKARSVIAINKDRSATIFKRADIGIVADLHEVIRNILSRLQKIKG
jgi:electron transfer flavoprotein alpha subunit